MPNLRQRPQAPLVHDNPKEHARLIAMRANVGLPTDGTHVMQAPLLLKSYTVAGLPTASLWEGGLVYVSNEAGGATIAFSNGTNWKRVQDLATVS